MTKDRITIIISNELFKQIRRMQADKQRNSTKTVSLSWTLEYCITSKKKFHVKKSARRVKTITIMINSKTLKKMRGIQADKQLKTEKNVSLSGVIENYLSH